MAWIDQRNSGWRPGRRDEAGMRGVLLILWLGALLAGCATTTDPLPPPTDPSAPGWETRQGQAVWKPSEDQPEIAGDLVISMHPAGGTVAQFSKAFPIVSARLTARDWEIDFPPQNKHYSGHGNPPKRIVWLQLLRALEGKEIPKRWTLIKPSGDYIALEDVEKGERLEVHFQK